MNAKDQFMTDLQKLLDGQNFKTEEDFNDFVKKMIENDSSLIQENLFDIKDKALDLIAMSLELKPAKAKINIEKALQLYPDCIEAYEILGSMERTAEIATVFYEKGISIGRKQFGGAYLKRNKGHYWGLHETRPFMRCLKNYADCLAFSGKTSECVTVLEEIIGLNPNDNQGVRDQLLLYLIQLGNDKKFLKYSEMFKEDSMTFSLLNHALFAFKTEGESEKANHLLTKALNQNKFVAQKILSNKEIVLKSGSYSPGDEYEADYYVHYAKIIWIQTIGSLEWLKKQSKTL